MARGHAAIVQQIGQLVNMDAARIALQTRTTKRAGYLLASHRFWCRKSSKKIPATKPTWLQPRHGQFPPICLHPSDEGAIAAKHAEDKGETRNIAQCLVKVCRHANADGC